MSGRSMFSHVRAMGLALAALACAELPTEPGVSGAGQRPSLDEMSIAATFAGEIRIGVVPAAPAVQVGGTGDYEIRSKATNALLMAGSASNATVTLSSRAVTESIVRLQVMCTGVLSARDARIALAQSLGYVTFTEFFLGGNCWRVYVGRLPAVPTTIRTPFRNKAIADGVAGTDSFFRGFAEIIGITEYKVTKEGVEAISASPVVVSALNGFVTIGGQRFRGKAEVLQNPAGLAGVNVLPMEEYLYGVVPRELPPNPYGAPEAQKAQAIAARTYAMQNLGKRAAEGFDLGTTTSDQVYGGLAAEHPVSSAAVDATAGIVGKANGALISALYHSTSGGYTANSEDVFANAFSYLRGVPDAERGRALEHVPSLDVFVRHPNPTNLRAKAEGDLESDWSRYHRWVVEWTNKEMAELLSGSFNTSVSAVRSITVTDRSDHGRVMRIVFDTDVGELVALKDNIRSRLRYYEVSSTGAKTAASLRSTLFYIEPVLDRRTKAVTGWKAYGGGWGHGVGMSQTGAVGLAERGYDFQRILAHYYQGIELACGYAPCALAQLGQ